MTISLILLFLLFPIVFYNEFKKGNLTFAVLIIFGISIIIKIMFVYFEIYGAFINQFTIRDEVTFLRFEPVENVSPGDNFFISFIYFFRDIYNDEIFIKFLPIYFSVIYFYYLLKIIDNLKYQYSYKLVLIIVSVISPAYLMFNYSMTKEFLQGVFLLPSVYYSFKIIDKHKLIDFFKLIFFLILFSYTHRGFEVISVLILISTLLLSIINNFIYFFKRNWLILLFLSPILIIIFYFIVINSPVGSNFASQDIAAWLNNIRESDPNANNSYRVTLESNETSEIIKTISLTVYYYFFYIQNISSLKHLYYFLDLILCSTLILVTTYYIFTSQKIYNNNIIKYLFLFTIFFAMSVGFAIFTYNTGNAIRHKSVTNVLIYLYLPILFDLISSFTKRSLKIFNQNYN